ncbi:hypothetical protein [Streptomyces sp. NPDC090994]|uniref:hypothetical protein n=1 Tax=Streptomyces sp. NPDC090994 TaxID=3365969 RepID=UPI00380BA0E8
MAEQLTPAPQQPAPTTATVPATGGFAPRFTTHPVGVLTLGSQKENDADKEWYFE